MTNNEHVHFIKDFITCWSLFKELRSFISAFLQHVEPLPARAWRPSAFVAEAVAAVPVGNKSLRVYLVK